MPSRGPATDRYWSFHAACSQAIEKIGTYKKYGPWKKPSEIMFCRACAIVFCVYLQVQQLVSCSQTFHYTKLYGKYISCRTTTLCRQWRHTWWYTLSSVCMGELRKEACPLCEEENLATPVLECVPQTEPQQVDCSWALLATFSFCRMCMFSHHIMLNVFHAGWIWKT